MTDKDKPEIIKKENLKFQQPVMSIAEKKAIASSIPKPIEVTKPVEQKPVEQKPVEQKPVELEITTDEKAPDADIKRMLDVIKSEAAEPIIEETDMPGMLTIDIKVLEGLLKTVYTAPYFIYRTGKYELSEFVQCNLNIRAHQLQTTLQLFGFVDPKYLVLLAFGTGFAMDMAMLVGDAKELGKKQKEIREYNKQAEFTRETEEQRMLKEGLAENKL